MYAMECKRRSSNVWRLLQFFIDFVFLLVFVYCSFVPAAYALTVLRRAQLRGKRPKANNHVLHGKPLSAKAADPKRDKNGHCVGSSAAQGATGTVEGRTRLSTGLRQGPGHSSAKGGDGEAETPPTDLR